MRRNFTLSTLGCALASAILISSATADDLQHPYIYRGTNGSWTNVEYNDGVCHYYYSYNSYDQNMKLNKYGDCSHVQIGPDGTAIRIVEAPPVIVERVR